MDSADRDRLLAPVGDLYTASLHEHGTVSQGVGWKDEASHRLRFDKLATVIAAESEAEGFTVNDLGCGYGAMFEYLRDRFGVALRRYYGYDVSEQMLTAARDRVTDERAEFLHGSSPEHDADYSFVSGTFNVKLDATHERWTEHVKASLLELSGRSRKGLAFNLLTTYVVWRADHLYYGDPYEFMDYCRRSISRYVALFHDYPMYEWTIIVRK
jgi:SAM-dependent methyltransferase